jgi:hypothetical protein
VAVAVGVVVFVAVAVAVGVGVEVAVAVGVGVEVAVAVGVAVGVVVTVAVGEEVGNKKSRITNGRNILLSAAAAADEARVRFAFPQNGDSKNATSSTTMVTINNCNFLLFFIIHLQL